MSQEKLLVVYSLNDSWKLYDVCSMYAKWVKRIDVDVIEVDAKNVQAIVKMIKLKFGIGYKNILGQYEYLCLGQ